MVSESGSILDFVVVVLLPESERSVKEQDILSLSLNKPVLVSLYTHRLFLEDDVPVLFKKEGGSSSVRLSSCRAEGMGGMGWGVPSLEYRSGSSGEEGEDPLLLSLPWLLY